jgi:hypothetical protein
MMEYISLPPARVRVGACFSENVFSREMKRLKVANAPAFVTGTAHACVHYFDEGGDVVCIMCMDAASARRRSGIEVVGLLVHEAVHVMQECRGWMREKEPGSEWEAYMVQHVAQFFMDKYTEAT